MSKQIQKSLEKTKQIQKSLRKCVSKIKIPKTKPILFRFNSCKHISKTSSFSSVRSELDDHFPAVNNNIEYSVNSQQQQQQQQQEEHKDNAVTLSDVDRFLFENFRSLFEDELTKKYGDKRGGGENGGFRFKSSLLFDPPPIIPENISRRIRASRFLVRTDSANSLVRSSSVTANYDSSEPEDEEEENESAAAEDFITLLTYSPRPYEDFRRSMMEMVKVRREHNGKVDWQFMEELLFCYLDLNNKKSYRYILRAFVDLAGVLRENSSAGRIGSNRRQALKVGGGKRQLRGGDLI